MSRASNLVHKSARTMGLLLVAATLVGCSSMMNSNLPEFVRDSAAHREPTDLDANQAALDELIRRRRAAIAAGDGAPREAEPSQIERNRVPDLPVQSVRPWDGATDADGALRRAAVRDFVNNGPHAILGVVTVSPAREGDRMLGYRLDAVAPAGTFLMDAGLQLGDVVREINGQSLSMPDVFLRTFRDAPNRDSLDVQVVRDGQPLTLRWQIVDDVPVDAEASR